MEGDEPADGGAATPADSVEEALARARRHGRRAAAEALAALRALLDAATLATAAAPAAEGGAAALARTLDQLGAWLDPEAPRNAAPLVEAILGALDAEIARWEQKSREDPDARAVLRAFLAVREVVWEMVARPAAPARPEDATAGGRRGGAATPRRVQRVPVEG